MNAAPSPLPLDHLPDRLAWPAMAGLRDLRAAPEGWRTFPGIAGESLHALLKLGHIGGIRTLPDGDGIIDLVAWLPGRVPPEEVDPWE